MKWIVLAIAVVVVPYTAITLHYRKPGKAFEPYRDLKKQANVHRLLSAGFHRAALIAERPADLYPSLPSGSAKAATASIAGGLPASLAESLIEVPTLPTTVGSVQAPASISALLPSVIEFTASLNDKKDTLHSAHLYSKDSELYLLVHFEHLPGELQSRSRENVVRLTIPGGTLQPGSYSVTLVATQRSESWRLEVR